MMMTMMIHGMFAQLVKHGACNMDATHLIEDMCEIRTMHTTDWTALTVKKIGSGVSSFCTCKIIINRENRKTWANCYGLKSNFKRWV